MHGNSLLHQPSISSPGEASLSSPLQAADRTVYLMPLLVRSATSPEGRLSEALQNDEASEATVQLKHFSRSLQSSHLTQPAQVPRPVMQ